MSGEDKLKILFVDDEPELQEQAKIFLEKENENLEVETAGSASNGLELLKKGDYAAVVSDYKMSEMNGIDFLKSIKELGRDVPFIILTGKGGEDVAVKALNLGADRYFRKGKPPRELYSKLADAVVDIVEISESSAGWRAVHSEDLDLLEKLLEGHLDVVTPEIDLRSDAKISYPEAETMMDIPDDEISEELDSLTRQGILERNFHDKIHVCPNCGSSNLKFSTLCPTVILQIS